ncbi:hypothetical protein JDN40_11925 [Rhodomicrobium vannielii ATCC 17100]|uniref:hypothetical protein n=1 Tax=Rhodomicrobium vannielii TaxID=1069 RepID=UPI001918C571|nr:hypothetical protein [Rhodomicrobium vannielii]MBJ7534815.1 hypothetical protein [Rhodomicrobium vannielii ATCC 17100]
MSDNAVRIVTSTPTELNRHDISDEELEMFRHWRTDHVQSYGQTSLGGIIGSVIPACQAFFDAFVSHVVKPMDVIGLLSIIVLTASSVGFALCLIIDRRRGRDYNAKIEEIRKRRNKKIEYVNRVPVNDESLPTNGRRLKKQKL